MLIKGIEDRIAKYPLKVPAIHLEKFGSIINIQVFLFEIPVHIQLVRPGFIPEGKIQPIGFKVLPRKLPVYGFCGIYGIDI